MTIITMGFRQGSEEAFKKMGLGLGLKMQAGFEWAEKRGHSW